MKLSPTEENLMHHLWARNKAYLKDLISDFPEPKPAKTTIATLLKRMTEKGFVAFNETQGAREYFPLIQKSEYSSNHINGLVKNYFNNSAAQLASFCATERNLSKEELEELKGTIDNQLNTLKK